MQCNSGYKQALFSKGKSHFDKNQKKQFTYPEEKPQDTEILSNLPYPRTGQPTNHRWH